MLLSELTEEIKPLSRIEKLLLIEKISKMLLEEEDASKFMEPDKSYPVYTPLNQEKGAAQLQKLIDQSKA